jgi:hypothetical protein
MERFCLLKKVSVVACLFGAVGFSHGSVAGAKYGQAVAVAPYAIWGSMGVTRASGSSVDYLEIIDHGSVIYVRARQATTGVSGSCVTSDPVRMQQLRSANSDAAINVGISDGQCTYLYLTNSSAQEPKSP